MWPILVGSRTGAGLRMGPRTFLGSLVITFWPVKKASLVARSIRDAYAPDRIQDLQPARMHLADEIEGKQSVVVLPNPDGKSGSEGTDCRRLHVWSRSRRNS